ncbi:hypothetical protein J6590_012290 [Homalodisca vitripennis]|nr:hypothetical protein J6590_012290 [Homalodisca vitripennis]
MSISYSAMLSLAKTFPHEVLASAFSPPARRGLAGSSGAIPQDTLCYINVCTIDTQARIKTNICHCPKTVGGGGVGVVARVARGLKNGQMHQNVFSPPHQPAPSAALWCIEEGMGASSVSEAMNHGTRSIRTPLFFPSLISGGGCPLS